MAAVGRVTVSERRSTIAVRLPTVTGTIPELFEAAAAEAGDRVWLRHEDEQYTYAQARRRIGGVAAALAEQGVGKGDRVLLVAPNDPATLFTWLAITYLGAISVATNPSNTESELAGLRDQLEPKLLIERAELADERDPDGPGPAGPDDPAVMIPTSGTTGQSKLVTQTHRGVRDGRRGLPVVDGAELRRPADDLAAALPHQRARLLRARLRRGARRPGAAPALLRQPLLRLGAPATAPPSSTRSARCSRS